MLQPRRDAPTPQPRPQAPAQTVKDVPEKEQQFATDQACREELRKLGVGFTEVPDVPATNGCSLPHPIEVSRLSARMRLEPPAILECGTALAAARFFQSAGNDLARKHLKTEIASVQQASGYVCQPINGANNLSEHAFGRALDVSGIAFSDETQIKVTQYGESGKLPAFLKALRAAACGPFATVLGPGTNADHEDHFHFDMKKRRTPYCR